MASLREVSDTYRVIVTRRGASEFLALPNGTEWVLPRIEVQLEERIAEQLTAEITRAWGVETYCLSVLTSSQDGEPKCAVMESIRQNDKAPAGTFWVPRVAVSRSTQASEARLIQESLEEVNACAINQKAGPFAKPGWLRELFHWSQERVAPLGLRLTGSFRQLNASPTFSLIRLEAEGGAVWFKATGEPNSHELPITVALARLFPRYIPQVLGVHQAWNGWLSAEVAGVSLDQITDFPAWERAAERLGELQVASIGKTGGLLEAQAKDLRVVTLAERIDPFVARMSELMEMQKKPTPAPLVRSELATLAEGLKESCALLESFGLPNTLGHIDFNPGNILVCGDRCVFLDWAEGCVTHPLLTFEYLREHMARRGIEKPAAGERLTAAYLRAWAAFFSLSDLRRALALSPLISVFAYATANDPWSSLDPVRNPNFAGYFRSLARRMYREAVHAAFRSEVCLD